MTHWPKWWYNVVLWVRDVILRPSFEPSVVIVRAALRILFAVGGGLLLVVAAVYLSRIWIAEAYIRSALEKRGFENVALHITKLGVNGIEIENFASGKPDNHPPLQIGAMRVDWNLGALQHGYIDALVVSDVSVSINQTDAGLFIGDAPLIPTHPATPSQTNFHLGRVSLDNANIEFVSASGTASVLVAGDYDRGTGGRFDADLSTANYGWQTHAIQNAVATVSATVTPDLAFYGRIVSSAGLVVSETGYPDLTFSAEFSGADLTALVNDRENANAEMVFSASAPFVALDSLATYAQTLELFAGAVPSEAAITATGHVYYKSGVFILENKQPDYLTVSTDTGLALGLSAPVGSRLVEWSPLIKYLNFNYAIAGLKASPADGSVTLVRSGTEPWTIDSLFSASAWNDTDFSLVPGRVTYSGLIDGFKIDGDTLFTGGATRLRTNNMVLSNLLLDGEFSISGDLRAREGFVTVPKGCITVKQPQAKTTNGTFDFADAKFCPPTTGPIVLRVSQSADNEFTLDADGVLSASNFDAQVGETTFSGKPPEAALNLKVRNRTAVAETTISGGRLNFNDRINFSRMTGGGQAIYREGDIMMAGDIHSLTLTDLALPVTFSPLVFSGAFSLREAAALFTGGLATPSGREFSNLEGMYDLKTGTGQAKIEFGLSNFNSVIQPADILPLLKGLVENAAGEADGEIFIDFAGGGIQSGGNFALKDFTFNGPTRAVTQTAGLNLDADFESLSPFKTNGVQTATIDLIDLDALKLENGEVYFEAPGDDTLRIQSAVWPWFGGSLGIYEGAIPLNGRIVTIPLEVKNIDMADLFDFLDINGLSGEGRLDGRLPIVVEDGEARIEGGSLRASGVGIIEYKSIALENAANSAGDAGKLAFDALSSFEFERLELDVDGSLSGEIQIGVRMEGNSDAVVSNAGINYNIRINAPILGLREQYQAQQEEKRKVIDELSERYGVELEFGEAEKLQPGE